MVSSTTGHMPDDHYTTTSSSWTYVDGAPSMSPTSSNASHTHQQRPSITTTPSGRDQGPNVGTSISGTSPPSAPSKPVSPPPRSSLDTPSKPSAPLSKWRDSISVESQDTMSASGAEQLQVVEPSFDENVLRALCDLNVSLMQFAVFF